MWDDINPFFVGTVRCNSVGCNELGRALGCDGREGRRALLSRAFVRGMCCAICEDMSISYAPAENIELDKNNEVV